MAIGCVNACFSISNFGGKAEAFRQWVLTSCPICATLVDRIVPGFPRRDIGRLQERCGYTDQMMVQAESFHLWVIEAAPGQSLDRLAKEFPAAEAGLNVLFVESEAPYHARKVTLLNGPHTVLSPVSFLAGLNIVRDACQHPVIGRFIHRVTYEELLPTLDLPESELTKFADSVMERFQNPYVDHQLTSIMLNSFPKFQTRDLPALKTFLQRKGTLPPCIVLGLAAIITYYKGGQRIDGTPIQPNDDARILNLLKELWQSNDYSRVAEGVLSANFIWGEDLTLIPGLSTLLADDLDAIGKDGMMATVTRSMK